MLKKLIYIIILSAFLMSIFATTAWAGHKGVRTGSTSARKRIRIITPFDWEWRYYGSHKSKSTLNEQTIRVLGELYVSFGHVDSCGNSGSGKKASCSTRDTWDLASAEAESYHYFYHPNFGSSSFDTSKEF